MKKFSVIGLLILLLILALSGILFLPIPFTRDQGIYSYVAWRWLGESWPYQYAFEHKGPWLYLLYAIALKFSRGAMWGVNFFDLLSRMTTVVFLWALARRMFNDKVAFVSALFSFLPLFSAFSSCWWNAQAETFIMPLSVLSVLFVFEGMQKESGALRCLFILLSGFVLSQILMLKPSGIWLIIGIIIFLFIFSRNKAISVSFYLCGLSFGLILWIYYFWLRGIGREFFEEVILFNLFHLEGQRKSLRELISLFGWEIWRVFGIGIIFFLLGIFHSFKNLKSPKHFLSMIWFFASLTEIVVQARFFFYHIVLLIPPTALIMGISLDGIEGRFRRVLEIMALIIILIWCFSGMRLYYLIQRHYQTLDYLRGRIDRGIYYARFQEPFDYNGYASWIVANWIRERTEPDEYVLIFGYEPGINYLSARRAPSRFHSDYPLTFEPKNKIAMDLQKRWRKIFLSDLIKNKPCLVVLVHNDYNALERIESYRQAMSFNEFWEWLLTEYQPGERIEDFEFWWRIEE